MKLLERAFGLVVGIIVASVMLVVLDVAIAGLLAKTADEFVTAYLRCAYIFMVFLAWKLWCERPFVVLVVCAYRGGSDE